MRSIVLWYAELCTKFHWFFPMIPWRTDAKMTSLSTSFFLRSTKEERFLIFWVACYRVGSLCTQAKADPCFFVPWFTFSAPFWMTSQFRCAKHSASCFAVCRTCWKVQALSFCLVLRCLSDVLEGSSFIVDFRSLCSALVNNITYNNFTSDLK